MKSKQVYPSVTLDPTLEGYRRLAQDIGDPLLIVWIDALIGGEQSRSSSTQPTSNGTEDSAK
jgi:hypothetical protein